MESVDLTQVPVVDNHCHGILLDQAFGDLASWRGAFTESTDPGMARDHISTTAFYQRLTRTLAGFLACGPGEQAVFEGRTGKDGREFAATLLRAANVDTLLIDTGFPPPQEVLPVAELGELGGCGAEPMLRLEVLMERLLGENDSLAGTEEALDAALQDVRAQGYVALKSIAAYRTGLDIREWPREDAEGSFREYKSDAEAGSARLVHQPLLDTLLHGRRSRRFPYSSTLATVTRTPTSCSATRSICVRFSSGPTTAACPSCCCTSAIRTPGREVTWPPSTRTRTSISPTAYRCSATVRCSPSRGPRSA